MFGWESNRCSAMAWRAIVQKAPVLDFGPVRAAARRGAMHGVGSARHAHDSFRGHTVGIVGYGGGPVGEDAQNAYIPVQNIQDLHHVAFAPDSGIESLIVKSVVAVSQNA